jgi:hypothetical protein
VETTGSPEETVESSATPEQATPDGQATLDGQATPDGQATAGPAWRRHRRPLVIALGVGLVGLLYLAYLGWSRSLGTDADGAGNVLQAWDMLHGNPLLRGWWLSDVSFYTTELPQYMLVELIHGLNAADISAAGAATYTLLILLAALLAKGRATGTAGIARALIAAGIMLAPGPGLSAGTLLSSPDHVGTQVPLLLAWLAIDRLADRWYLPWLVGILLTWVEIADQMAMYVGALPVIVVSAIWLSQRRPSWRTDAGLLVAAAASVGLAEAAVLLIRRVGGFVVAPASTAFTTSEQMPHNLWLTVESVLTLFGADFFGLRFGLVAAVALLHLVGVILVAWAFCIAARRLASTRDRVIPILVVGIAIDLAAYAFSTQAFDLGAARDLAAVLPFGAVLAGRLIPDRPAARTLLPALLAVLVGYTGVLAYHATRPAQPPPTQAVGTWLMANHLTDGIGNYWAANITTAATSGQVRVRPIALSCGRFAADVWESKKSWYESPSTATFLLLALTKGAGANGTAATATAQFGVPQRTARIGDYEVIVWNHDLLPAVMGGFPPGCGPKWRR